MTSPATYPHSVEFQKRLFACVIRDHLFLKTYGDVVKAEFFTNEHCRLSMQIVEDYYKKYRVAPTLDAFVNLISEEARRKPPTKEVAKSWASFLDEVGGFVLSDMRYLEDAAIAWAKHQSIRKLAEDLAGKIDDAEKTGEPVENLMQMVRDATMIGAPIPDPMTNYLESTDKRLLSYWETRVDKVPTFMIPLDKVLDGGLSRGELAVIASPTSRGKTTAMIQLGCIGAMYAGQRVLAVTLELSLLKFQQRIDRCVSLSTTEEIRENPGEVVERVNTLRQFKGDLRVVEFPSRRCTVDTIEQTLERYKGQDGWVPTVLVVDYATILKPSERRSDNRFEIEQTILDLRSVARERHLACWTAAQTNRGSFKKDIITTADIGECLGIAQHCDVMVTICQTDQERAENRCRFYLAKNREGVDHKAVHLEFNRYINRFQAIYKTAQDIVVEGKTEK